jgi:phenylalanyl-tRNA synthetase beta chain
MIISWNWLKDYVPLDTTVEELTARLTMAGLNLESVEPAGDDLAVDLEVTSNRPDCLGHMGVAREAAVLFGRELTIPPALPRTIPEKTASVTSVAIECEDLCPHYIARMIRGVKIGPSPDWLRRRLETLGIAAINNVVDVTNYVLMECGQPLHAFDFDKLRGRRIVVRRARAGEKIIAIDQREYALDAGMCVIADADRPVAIGGVMGGLQTEIGDRTTNVLIETADFAPLSIRNTARKLNLHSDSSYRFERGVDRENQEWASRRCCELILDVAGGELLDGPVVAGKSSRGARPPIVLRFAQLKRLLGIDVPSEEAVRILTALGLRRADVGGSVARDAAAFVPPSWRRDLEREADLIEEVARIHGYDKIPADVPVPLVPSARTRRDRVTSRVRNALTAAGFFEAMTLSFVSRELFELFTPRGERSPITVEHSSRRHENILRQSLVPSLLASRRENERHGTSNAELFEIARVYLEAAPGRPEREVEPTMIGLVTGRPFAELKGVLETLVRVLNRGAAVSVRPASVPQFAAGRGAELLLDGQPCGWLGELDRAVTDRLDLRDAATVAEFDLAALDTIADLTPRSQPLPQFPAIERDLNFVLDESVTWEQLAAVVRSAAGPLLESIGFGGQYRGQQIPAGKKSYVVTFSYRAADRTLTGEEVEASQQAVIEACGREVGAALR